jgi:hypothetical protein
MIGADGGSDSWLISILNRVFQCSHRRQSRPITPRGGGQTYAVCLDCGTRVAYDLSGMRAEASVLRISLGRQTPEVGKEEIFDIPEHQFLAPAPGRQERMSQDSGRFHRDFGTIAVLCIGVISLAGGLLYLPNRPAGLKNVTQSRARPSPRAAPAKSSPSRPAEEDAVEVFPDPPGTAPAAPTVSFEPLSTTGGKTIELESGSPSAGPGSNSGSGRLEGDGSVIVLAREAMSAIELSQHPETLSKLIRRGSLFTVPRGTEIKLLQGNGLVTKVRITEGSRAGQEGWAQPGQARLLSSTSLVNSSPSMPLQERGTGVALDPQATRLAAKATVSTTPTIGERAIKGESTSTSSAPRSNSAPGRLSGNGSVIVLAREAGAALELSQHPERLSKLIQNGSLFTVPRGTAIKLVQGNRLGNRLVIRVLIMNGSKVGQEGWAQTWPISP